MAANQIVCSRLEQRSVIKFWWLKIANHVNFPEESRMCMEKHVLVQKILLIGLNMGLLL